MKHDKLIAKLFTTSFY